MRKIAVALALILGLGLSAMADVKPSNKAEVKVASNGFNMIQVQVPDADQDAARVKVYDADFALLHSERISSTEPKYFDISNLRPGTYIVKVERNGEVIYTEVVNKVR